MSLVRSRPADRDLRIVVIITVAATAAALTWVQATVRPTPSDFSQTWAGARALLAGQNPYEAVGPGRAFDFPYPLFYPVTAMIAAIPLTPFPERWADAVFMALSSGLLAWALTRQSVRNPQLLVFGSFAWFYAIDTVQWSPLLTAAALVPALGGLLLCKPSIGLALFLAAPSRRALISAAVFGGLTVVIVPWGLRAWLAMLPLAHHFIAPILAPGGVFILLALARWRRPEARLLVVLACIPQTPALYEAVPLFLVVRDWWEGALLVAVTPTIWLLTRDGSGYSDLASYNAARAVWQVWLLYLPCVVMVLRRPNVGIVQAWSWPSRESLALDRHS